MNPQKRNVPAAAASLLQQLYPLIPDGVLIWSPEQNETRFSPKLRKMLGYTAQSHSADWDEWLRHIHPEDRDLVTRTLAENRSVVGATFDLTMQMITAQSTHLQAYCRGCVIADPSSDGHPIVILTVSSDDHIPEALQSTWREGKLYRTTINNIHDIVFVVDRSRTVVLMNRTAKRALARYGMRGVKEGISLEDLLAPYRPDYMEHYDRAFREGTTFSFEAETEIQGKKLWGDWTQIPIKNQNGEVQFILTTIRDITFRKTAELEKSQFESEAIAQFHLTQIGMLAGELIHNLKNPLTILTINNTIAMEDSSEVLGRGEQNPKILFETLDELAERLLTNKRGIERLNELVEDVQHYSTINRDLAETSVQDINSILMADTKMVTANSILQQQAEIRIALSQQPLYAKVPPGVVTQIFLNLANNAIEAMEECEERILSIRSGRENGFVWFEVNDTGCGFPEEVQKKLGQPFITTKSSRDALSSVNSGTGLGMYLVLKSLKRYGGMMKMESEPGNTRIRILFPNSFDALENEA